MHMLMNSVSLCSILTSPVHSEIFRLRPTSSRRLCYRKVKPRARSRLSAYCCRRLKASRNRSTCNKKLRAAAVILSPPARACHRGPQSPRRAVSRARRAQPRRHAGAMPVPASVQAPSVVYGCRSRPVSEMDMPPGAVAICSASARGDWQCWRTGVLSAPGRCELPGYLRRA
jgi:hypothetical protein